MFCKEKQYTCIQFLFNIAKIGATAYVWSTKAEAYDEYRWRVKMFLWEQQRMPTEELCAGIELCAVIVGECAEYRWNTWPHACYYLITRHQVCYGNASLKLAFFSLCTWQGGTV